MSQLRVAWGAQAPHAVVKAAKPLKTIGAIPMPDNPTAFTTEAARYFSCSHLKFLKESNKKCATNGFYI
jgi:hypothetical protein